MQNYKIILEELTKICSHITSFKQIKQPKLSNLELIALNLTVEYSYINTECQLFRSIKGTGLEFKFERTNFKKQFETQKADFDTKMKSILTPEQYSKWLEKRANHKNELRQHRDSKKEHEGADEDSL